METPTLENHDELRRDWSSARSSLWSRIWTEWKCTLAEKRPTAGIPVEAGAAMAARPNVGLESCSGGLGLRSAGSALAGGGRKYVFSVSIAYRVSGWVGVQVALVAAEVDSKGRKVGTMVASGSTQRLSAPAVEVQGAGYGSVKALAIKESPDCRGVVHVPTVEVLMLKSGFEVPIAKVLITKTSILKVMVINTLIVGADFLTAKWWCAKDCSTLHAMRRAAAQQTRQLH
ncbi:hypothetical protein CcaCcLH18_12369 [Colletotrichum camelliae]|nr:hypothetical protein CcaCcLH18_12369 [Colletotrichum camelliae]